MKYRALADRVEALTAPDRIIDAEIMFDRYAVPVGTLSDQGPRGYLWPENNSSWNFGIRFPGRNRDWFNGLGRDPDRERLLIERDGALVLMNELRIPKLTASVDAAMKLIPEGWVIAIGATFDGRATAVLGPRGNSYLWKVESTLKADTLEHSMAIAIVVASLRAEDAMLLGRGPVADTA